MKAASNTRLLFQRQVIAEEGNTTVIIQKCLILSGILYPKPAWLEIGNLLQQLSVPMLIAANTQHLANAELQSQTQENYCFDKREKNQAQPQEAHVTGADKWLVSISLRREMHLWGVAELPLQYDSLLKLLVGPVPPVHSNKI